MEQTVEKCMKIVKTFALVIPPRVLDKRGYVDHIILPIAMTQTFRI